MKVLMRPVILGFVVPWRQREYSEKAEQYFFFWCVGVWGLGLGLCPEGIFTERFSQNAMWPSLPHGAVGILWNCWQYPAERWPQTQAQRWMSLMVGGISGCLLYLKGGAADSLSFFWQVLHFFGGSNYLKVQLQIKTEVHIMVCSACDLRHFLGHKI